MAVMATHVASVKSQNDATIASLCNIKTDATTKLPGR